MSGKNINFNDKNIKKNFYKKKKINEIDDIDINFRTKKFIEILYWIQ